ncbi:hypothetical protein CTAYLR_003080 [Chrysophaeum taylorii]|uniref:Uncharacterized protein n=1 Tax=Chrysophaeum taylorii TaxID=2483200 RepID=A0AAD7U5W1_9STRA|nr:hypothetical protein CTAYLR_003080 [Chrysophaeum taylorii]
MSSSHYVAYVKVIRGMDLVAKDRGLLRSNKSDPYCVVTVDGKVVGKTPVVYRNLNPEWSCDAFRARVVENSVVRVQILDYDELSTDDPMGEVNLRVLGRANHGLSKTGQRAFATVFEVRPTNGCRVSGFLELELLLVDTGEHEVSTPRLASWGSERGGSLGSSSTTSRIVTAEVVDVQVPHSNVRLPPDLVALKARGAPRRRPPPPPPAWAGFGGNANEDNNNNNNGGFGVADGEDETGQFRRPVSLARHAFAATVAQFGEEVPAMRRMLRVIERSRVDFDHDELDECEKALGNAKYTDLTFPPLGGAVVYDPHDPLYEMTLGGDVVWRRPTSFCSKPLLFENGIEPGDIIQGKLGNCWLLSALSALAEFPKLVEKCFHEHHRDGAASESGIYRVRLCLGGLWQWVTVDDALPCVQRAGSRQSEAVTPVFSRGLENELWVQIVEKAMAKACGSFARLRKGFADDGLINLTGCPAMSRKLDEPDIQARIEMGTLFDDYFKAPDRQELVICSSTKRVFDDGLDGLDDDDDDDDDDGCEGLNSPGSAKSRQGLVPVHAYALLSAVTIKGHNLVRLRNPWAHCEWEGPWGDDDPRWTLDMKREAAAAIGIKVEDVVKPNDGTFWMDFDDYLQYFQRLYVCLPHVPSNGNPWCERRCRGSFDYDSGDAAELYSLTLSRDAAAYVMLHQRDQRVRGSPAYSDLALAVLRVVDDDDGGYEYFASSSPSVQRQVVCPAVEPGAIKVWPKGRYLVCAYSAACRGLRKPRLADPGDWPEEEARLFAPAVSEIFDRFDAGLKGYLDARDIRDMASATHTAGWPGVNPDGVVFRHSAELRAWLLEREDRFQLLASLGYEPTGKLSPPALTSICPIAVSLHADDPGATLEKRKDDARLIHQARILPLLQAGVKKSFGDVDAYVSHAAGGGGVTVLCKNVSETRTLVNVVIDASESTNCENRLDNTMKADHTLAPNEAHIMLHVTPVKPSLPWKFRYKLWFKHISSFHSTSSVSDASSWRY